MRYNLLGRTGLYVSELCLGTMTFGGKGELWGKIGHVQLDLAKEMLKASFDAGINFIDTANVYSFGESEQLTGEAIKQLGLPRNELVIATKATGIMDDTPNGRGQSRYHLMNALDDSLRRLQVDHIDLYQLHGVDPLTPLDEALDTLNDMVRLGKVRYVGICNMAAWQIMKLQGLAERKGWSRIESVQAYYTIAGRDLEREIVPLVEDQQMGVMVWSPLCGGLLTGKYKPDGTGPDGSRRANFDFPVVDKPRAFRTIEVMRSVAAAHEATVAQVALAWLLSRSAVTSVIIGAKTVDQLNDNLGSTTLSLTDEELQQLDEVSKLPPEYPGWMIERQGEYRSVPPTKP